MSSLLRLLAPVCLVLVLLGAWLGSRLHAGPLEDCGNRVDDDADGLVDEFDPDCRLVPDCTEPRPPSPTGTFIAMEKCRMEEGGSGYDVPVAADLDGDGTVEVVITHGFELLVMNGEDCELQQNARLGGRTQDRDAGVALADVDRNGFTDVFVQTGDEIERWEHDPALPGLARVWTATDVLPGADDPDYREGLHVVDLNGDGVPELVPRQGRLVDAITGTVRSGVTPDYSTNSGHGMVAFARDAEPGDANVEMIVGSFLYRYDFAGDDWEVVRQADGTAWLAQSQAAVADLDLDGDVDAIVTDQLSQSILAWDLQTTTVLAGPLRYGGDRGSTPAVGNFDDDDAPEIAFLNNGRLFVHDDLLGRTGGNPLNTPGLDVRLWDVAHGDGSGNTQLALFDFDGDGQHEIVYRDTGKLRIFRGRDGMVLLDSGDDRCNSDTGNEHPTIVDVDLDGMAEVIVSCSGFVAVYESVAGELWLPARTVWDQSAYQVTNIHDDLAVPEDFTDNFRLHNHYHAQVSPGLYPESVAVPRSDVAVSSLRIEPTAAAVLDCDVDTSVELELEVCVPADVAARAFELHYFLGDPRMAGAVHLNEVLLTEPIPAGECRTFVHLVDFGADGDVFVVLNTRDDTAPVDFALPFFFECELANNVAGVTVCSPDSDGDGLRDDEELALGTDPAVADTDDDGLGDGEEVVAGLDGHVTDPLDRDTDDDGLGDGFESISSRTDPTNVDTDADGVQDGTELGRTMGIPDPDGAGPIDGTDSAVFRMDADPSTTTAPTVLDTDGGGSPDGAEDADGDGAVGPDETDPQAGEWPDDVDGDGDRIPDVVEIGLGSDPLVADTDGDGIDDGEELIPGTDGHVTSLFDADSDDDGLSDFAELAAGTDPNDYDTDRDAVSDGVEAGVTTPVPDPDGPGPLRGSDAPSFVADVDPASTTDPLVADTDGGGVAEGIEDLNRDGNVDLTESDPNVAVDDLDSDGDGLSNQAEMMFGGDPDDPDTDGDGLLDGQELAASLGRPITSLIDADTDDDGLSDGEEVLRYRTDPLDPDSDGDGLPDGLEAGVTMPVPDPDDGGPLLGTDPALFVGDSDPSTTTNPRDPDTDEGGTNDGDEDVDRDGAIDDGETDPMVTVDDLPPGPDTDGDGLTDEAELALGTDPFDVDSDDDGVADGEEVDDHGSDPLDADSDDDGLPDGVELGRTMPLPDPDGDGPLLGTDPDGFVPDADPSTRSDPTNPDTDGGGVLDGAEDRNQDGALDMGEQDPTSGNAADDPLTDCVAAPLFEVDGAPVFGLRVAKEGESLRLSWSPEHETRPAPCIVYDVYLAEDHPSSDDRPPVRARTDYRRVAIVGEASFVHRGALSDENAFDYLVVARSLSAGEGSWGFGWDGSAPVAR
ncbi:MAG: FG-GAP-like repeat-containing protein [Acidobacteriota bacterium]